MAYIPFDRTPFYRDLASIEGALRRDMPGAGKIKMTVAEMILAFNNSRFPLSACGSNL
jgi:hypothetical protein